MLAAKLPSISRTPNGTPRSFTATSDGKARGFWEDGKSEAAGTDEGDIDWEAFENDLKVRCHEAVTYIASQEWEQQEQK